MRERSEIMETLGIFRDIETAATAVDGLIRAGFTEEQIDSLTSVPYPDGVLVRTGRRSWFRWLALAGGLAGAVAGFGLAAGTAWLYPVQTGDKPIIALYPTAIISFEVAMLFAIIGTMAGMFLEMRLPALKKRPCDPAIAEGCIGICLSIHAGGEPVACRPGEEPGRCIGGIASLSATEQKERAEEIMRAAGALRITAEVTQ
jgi:ActD protein